MTQQYARTQPEWLDLITAEFLTQELRLIHGQPFTSSDLFDLIGGRVELNSKDLADSGNSVKWRQDLAAIMPDLINQELIERKGGKGNWLELGQAVPETLAGHSTPSWAQARATRAGYSAPSWGQIRPINVLTDDYEMETVA